MWANIPRESQTDRGFMTQLRKQSFAEVAIPIERPAVRKFALDPTYVVGAYAIAGLLTAAVIRGVWNYPWCWNDEGFYVFILEQRELGVIFPISGALYVWLLEFLTPLLHWSYASTVSLLGIVSVPILLLIAARAYRDACGAAAVPAILGVLTLSSYFFAPLLESKPQQWGEFFALAGGLSACRAMRGAGSWWLFSVCAALVSLLHILSFGILVAVCGLVWLQYFLAGTVDGRTGAALARALTPGVAITLLPGGPFAVLIEVLFQNHIVDHKAAWTLVTAMGTAFALSIGSAPRLRPTLASVGQRLRRATRSHAGGPVVIVLAGSVVLLGLQALLLPQDYWSLYDRSLPRFLFAQSGNLVFLLLVAGGIARAWVAYGHRPLPEYLADVAALTIATAIVGCVALISTVWMTDTNWLLRVVGYGVLFAAPFAAYEARELLPHHHTAKLVVWLTLATISLLAAVKSSWLMSC
jgi:hypothetical protein